MRWKKSDTSQATPRTACISPARKNGPVSRSTTRKGGRSGRTVRNGGKGTKGYTVQQGKGGGTTRTGDISNRTWKMAQVLIEGGGIGLQIRCVPLKSKGDVGNREKGTVGGRLCLGCHWKSITQEIGDREKTVRFAVWTRTEPREKLGLGEKKKKNAKSSKGGSLGTR